MDGKKEKKITAQFWKNLFTRNLFIKIFSIVAAAVIWLLIMNINDPYKTKSFIVPVELVNEEAIREVNKVYEVTEGSYANVSVRGKRSVVDNLSSDDISATADLSNLSAVNAVAIEVGLKTRVSSDVTFTCDQVLKVSLEDRETKQMKVMVDTEGAPGEGYAVGECAAHPNVIEVSGGSSVIDRISSVRVTLNVNGATQSFSKTLTPSVYDEAGNLITSSTLTFSDEDIKVRAKLLQNKTVSVRAEVTGTPAEGYAFAEVTCLPETIVIAGTEKQLASVADEIVIPIDIEGITDSSADTEREIPVQQYLPEDIVVSDEYETVSVQIVIERVTHKKLEIPVENLKMYHLSGDCTAQIYQTGSSVEVTVEGRESVVDQMEQNINYAYVECEGLSEGVHKVEIQIDKEDVTVVKSDTVNVLIAQK